jgi:hypothetical protein
LVRRSADRPSRDLPPPPFLFRHRRARRGAWHGADDFRYRGCAPIEPDTITLKQLSSWRRDMFSRFIARARSTFTIAESVERLGVMPPAPGVARSAFKPLGKQGSRSFGFLSPQGRIDGMPRTRQLPDLFRPRYSRLALPARRPEKWPIQALFSWIHSLGEIVG